MSQSFRRVVFIKAADLQDFGRIRPLLIPALLKLEEHGYWLIIDSQPQDEPCIALIKSQGIRFQAVIVATGFDQRPHVAAFREALGGAGLDLNRSVVIGSDEVDRAFAANLGVRLLTLADTEDAWLRLAEAVVRQPRTASVHRATSETKIDIKVDLDPVQAASNIATGIGFFDHMLAQLSRHSGIAMQIKVVGDLHIDEHHTVEDTALALGQALKEALGDRFGIERYAFTLPMDESLAQVAMDLSGRPYLKWNVVFPRTQVGELSTEMVEHFFRSLTEALGATLHVNAEGENTHHMVEGIFKAVARTLGLAVGQSRERGVPSTKGVL